MRGGSNISRSLALRWGPLALGLVVGVIVVAGSDAASARGATLRWKFQPGEVLHYTMDRKTVLTDKLPGAPEIKLTWSQMFETTWTVKSVDSGGQAEVVQTIDRIRDQIESQTLGSYTYDSKDGKEPEGLIAASKVPLFKAMIGAPISFKISPLGEPTDIRVPEKLAQTLRTLSQAAGGGTGAASEEELKEMVTQATLVFPQDDLAVGKTWTRAVKNPAAPPGMPSSDLTYRFEGPAPDAGSNVVKIGLARAGEIAPPADAIANPNAPKIKSQKTEGAYLFDPAAGHLVDFTLNETGEVATTVKVGPGAAAKEFELTRTIDSRTTRKLAKDEKGGARP
jgi:hypothetical protein